MKDCIRLVSGVIPIRNFFPAALAMEIPVFWEYAAAVLMSVWPTGIGLRLLAMHPQPRCPADTARYVLARAATLVIILSFGSYYTFAIVLVRQVASTLQGSPIWWRLCVLFALLAIFEIYHLVVCTGLTWTVMRLATWLTRRVAEVDSKGHVRLVASQVPRWYAWWMYGVSSGCGLLFAAVYSLHYEDRLPAVHFLLAPWT